MSDAGEAKARELPAVTPPHGFVVQVYIATQDQAQAIALASALRDVVRTDPRPIPLFRRVMVSEQPLELIAATVAFQDAEVVFAAANGGIRSHDAEAAAQVEQILNGVLKTMPPAAPDATGHP